MLEDGDTRISLDWGAAMSTIFGSIPDDGYSTFSGERDMAYAENVDDNDLAEILEGDSNRYYSFGETRNIDF